MEQNKKTKRYIQIAIIVTLVIGVSGMLLHLHTTINNIFGSQQQMQITEKGERLNRDCDLKLYDLKGKVKDVTWLFIKDEDGDTIREQNLHFTYSGIATRNRYDSQNNIDSKVKILRNADGTQSTYENTIKIKDRIYHIKAEYGYDSIGALQTENIYIDSDTITRHLTYNNGVCLKRREVIKRADFTADEIQEYQYIDFDAYGNWTKRNITKKGIREYRKKNNPREEYTKNHIEERIITYYE